MLSFVNFLLTLKDDDSAMGDLARDAFVDDRISKRWGFNKFMDHITISGACQSARLTACACLVLYNDYTGRNIYETIL